MHLRLSSLPGLLAAALLLAACAKEPPPVQPPLALTAEAAPIRLAVGAVDVSDAFQPGDGATSFIDKRRSQELVMATRQLLQEKVEAAGGPGYVRAQIEKASLVERPRQVTGGVKGLFLNEPSRDLVAEVDVRLVVVGPSGTERAYAVARVSSSRGIVETASVNDRDRIAAGLTQELMLQLDRALRQTVHEGLHDYRAP